MNNISEYDVIKINLHFSFASTTMSLSNVQNPKQQFYAIHPSQVLIAALDFDYLCQYPMMHFVNLMCLILVIKLAHALGCNVMKLLQCYTRLAIRMLLKSQKIWSNLISVHCSSVSSL